MGKPISPENIDLITLNQFMGEVIELLQGDLERSDLGKPKVVISSGSIKIAVASASLVTSSLASDIAKFELNFDLDGIAPKRAQVLEKWRKRSSESQHFSINVGTHSLKVDRDAQFRHRQKDQWVRVEKYLRGKVVDAGGKTTPNIHLVLPGNRTIKINATEDQLRGSDFLYETVTLEVRAKEHIGNGELKDLHLIEVHRPKSQIDESKLEALWKNGSEAWSDVGDVNQWVEGLRNS